MALAVSLAFLLARKNSYFLPMVTTMLCGFVMYIIKQKQGLSRDLSLAIFGSTVCLSLTLLIAARAFVTRLFPEREVKTDPPL